MHYRTSESRFLPDHPPPDERTEAPEEHGDDQRHEDVDDVHYGRLPPTDERYSPIQTRSPTRRATSTKARSANRRRQAGALGAAQVIQAVPPEPS